MQARRTQTEIAAEVDSRTALALEKRAESLPELNNVGAKQFGFGNAADIVLAENGRFEHEFRG